MFGYVRICKPQMKICEYEVYQSVYCTLCRRLGRQLGLPSRLLLNYDYTFLTMLMIALSDEPCAFAKGCCTFNPTKKCGKCTTHTDAFDYTASLTAIMFYYKLRDNIHDAAGGKRLLWRSLMPYASHIRRKAARRCPEEDALVAQYLQRQFEAEKQARDTLCVVADALCEPTADVIAAFAQRLSDDPKKQTVLRHFGYFLGRWIYMIDALDDLDQDIAEGAFNPLALQFGLTLQDVQSHSEAYEAARCFGNDSLNASIAEAVKYYELLDIGAFKPILDNILYLGMGEAQKAALFRPKRRRQDRTAVLPAAGDELSMTEQGADE